MDPTGHEPLSTYLLMYGIFALLLGAGYIYAKNAPPSTRRDPLEDIDADAQWFDVDFRHPFQVGKEKIYGIGIGLSIWKGSIYLDDIRNHSIYTAIGNATAYIGVDLANGLGIDLSANVAEVGYDGRIIDASLQGLTVGFAVLYHAGKIELEAGALLLGWSASIDLFELRDLLMRGE